MKKDEFLIAIEANLSEYPESWVEGIIEKYTVIFDKEISQGLTEDAVVEKLGDPFLLAQKCKQEGYIPPLKENIDQDNGNTNRFKEENDSIKLPDLNTIEHSSKTFLQKTFRLLTFVVFLILALPLFASLLFLFSVSLVVFLAGFIVSLGVFIAPSYIDVVNTIPKSIVTFGGLGTITLGITTAIGGILLLKLNVRFIKGLTKKISQPITDKKEYYPINENRRLKRFFVFFMGLTLIFYGILLIFLNSYQ
ncbi:DUF1700 domain-containing protein [Alloiococcus sp. CFN-8]|uniref:DUF1700 domain-containing protein n=1 Tax=Alloiococcus sp. CFN-8 TaxID=3416081 RepID=UPI003CE8955B